MRILHTSDWHLGRSFHGAPLLPEQSEIVDRLVALTSDRDIDLVLIAGDLYDRAIPPSDAVRLLDNALVRLREAGASIVAITGNHDSPSRVAVADRILERAGVAIRGDVSRCIQPLQFDPDDGGSPVSIFPVPYLEPSLARPVLDQLDRDTDTADTGGPHDVSRHDHTIAPSPGHQTPEIEEFQRAGHRRVSHHDVTKLATKLIRRTATASGPTRTIVVAHTFVDRGTPSESERDLSIGNIDKVGLDVFGGFDYVALGHLHRSQAFNDGRVAYSGSPLPYSFSEENDTKSVRIIEMNTEGQCSTEVVPLGVGRPLRTLRGRLDDLLNSPEFSGARGARVRVRLTDPELPLQAMAQIQRRFPHAAVLEHVPEGRKSPDGGDVAEAVANSDNPLELALRFWADQHGVEASEAQQVVLASAIHAATGESDE
ncbi:exonuclease SbcCD subunit D [Candidatus Poriferisodalis sp.]|uniref:exonuclease SbcCD subunit D n=1 Tax=Candidatus Poriferisodalis sp. TaxID=3101277 RepID=UPI003B016346